jgi:hypothetical protein
MLLVLSNCFLKLVDRASGPLSLAPMDLAIRKISPTIPVTNKDELQIRMNIIDTNHSIKVNDHEEKYTKNDKE